MTVTEVGCMGVKPGLNIMDPSTEEGQILAGAWKTVTSKPGGPQRVYWGLEAADPSKVWAFFDFDSVEQHRKFAEEYGAEAVKDIPKMCTHGEFSKHIKMDPTSDILLSPVTELMLVYFPSDISEKNQEELAELFRLIILMDLPDSPGLESLAHGWGLEKDFNVRGKDGQVGSVLMCFLGWAGVDAQAKVHETDAYKQTLSKVQNMKGAIGFCNVSLSCQHLERLSNQAAA
ncbi:hypothetical protein FALBO_7046 [Fusarium albosuccineum]|uniref:ABM domain-containing protein n=1 Tax=Fusarium albosuccineum TaxID=1237068 RepID=A0A8H4LDE9_9HYPO|nr:hypothetical protein FALBO_7046 [Fusarium albosuccineum]